MAAASDRHESSIVLDHVATFEREATLVAAALRKAPEGVVPTAPGWDVTEVAKHLSFLYVRLAAGLRNDDQDPFFRSNETLPSPPEVTTCESYEAASADLLAALREDRDPDRAVYTFDPVDKRAAFWHRRVAHETTVHRVDAELGAGIAPSPIPAAEAVDGIEELFFSLTPRRLTGKELGAGETVHLHATDAEGEWLVTLGASGLDVAHGHAKGDAAVRGTAGDLELWLWGRLPLERLETFGDAALAEKLRVLLSI